MTGLAPSLLGQVDGRMLRDKSGSPIEEVFPLRLGTALAVDYGENHQVCKMEIRPARNVSSVIPAALIGELINEIVPLFTRGTPGRQSVACSGINCREMAEYERIIIGRSAGDVTPNPQAETQNPLAVILFKSCQARTDSVITNTVCRSALYETEDYRINPPGWQLRVLGLGVWRVRESIDVDYARWSMRPRIQATASCNRRQQSNPDRTSCHGLFPIRFAEIAWPFAGPGVKSPLRTTGTGKSEEHPLTGPMMPPMMELVVMPADVLVKNRGA
jgi:hypothetical protein